MITASAKTVQELLVTHEDYDGAFLEKIGDFYEGGKRFARNKGKYLRARMQDKNPSYRAARLACADYTPHMSGKVDDLQGGITRNPPRITVNDTQDARAEYWSALIRNADGCGCDLAAVTRNVLLDEMLTTRAYFLIRTPNIQAIEGETTAQAKERGRLDCTVTAVPASMVDDWACDDDGKTIWLRTHCVETARQGFGVPVKEIHRWTYFEADAVTIYEAERKIENGSPVAWDENHPSAFRQGPHGLKIIPLVAVQVPAGFNLGGRLLPIAEGLFNREAALEFALDMGALNLPILITSKPADQVPLSEVGVLNVGIDGDFKFTAPSGEVFKALSDDCKRLLEAMEGASQAMAEKASAANDRTSGVAQQQFRAPKEVLMALYAMPTLDALTIVVNAIAEFRGETSLAPKVEGLDDFDTQGTELAIANTQTFLALPGIPLTAKKLALWSVIAAFLPEIEPDDQKKLDDEIDGMEDAPPIPPGAPPIPPGGTITSSTNVKTGLAQGTGADQIRQKAIKR